MLHVKIQTNTEAFGCKKLAECARILRDIADKIDEGNRQGIALDQNQTFVGKYRVTNR